MISFSVGKAFNNRVITALWLSESRNHRPNDRRLFASLDRGLEKNCARKFLPIFSLFWPALLRKAVNTAARDSCRWEVAGPPLKHATAPRDNYRNITGLLYLSPARWFLAAVHGGFCSGSGSGSGLGREPTGPCSGPGVSLGWRACCLAA